MNLLKKVISELIFINIYFNFKEVKLYIFLLLLLLVLFLQIKMLEMN